MNKTKNSKSSAITRLNRLVFTYELHLWVTQCLKLNMPEEEATDDVVEHLVDTLTFDFLDEEVERCNVFGHELILDDLTKQKAKDFVLLKYPTMLIDVNIGALTDVTNVTAMNAEPVEKEVE